MTEIKQARFDWQVDGQCTFELPPMEDLLPGWAISGVAERREGGPVDIVSLTLQREGTMGCVDAALLRRVPHTQVRLLVAELWWKRDAAATRKQLP